MSARPATAAKRARTTKSARGTRAPKRDGTPAELAATYDAGYFRKWYRDPSTRVHARGTAERRLGLALGVTEYLLERPLRSLLDVGCGEGPWQVVLKGRRPRAHYVGVDPSEYAVRRFGKRRNIHHGTLQTLPETLAAAGEEGTYDLVVACDVLNYLSDGDLVAGLRTLRERMSGVAYLELWTDRDEMEGDLAGWRLRPVSFYHRLFRSLDLVRVGMHCFVGDELSAHVGELERAGR